MNDPAGKMPATVIVMRAYYALTVVFVLLDYAGGLNVRLSFLDGLPGWRALYYVVCFACLGLMLWQPRWTVFVTAAESAVNVSMLIISMALRVVIVSDEMIESGRGAVTVEEIVNFCLAGGAAYISFARASRAAMARLQGGRFT